MSFPKPRNLSKKKNRRSITLPEFLEEWILRYLKYQQSKAQKKGTEVDRRYENFSSLTSYILERVMNLFLTGKNLEDLQMIPDRKIQKFYDKITFKAVIPYYEQVVYSHKYQELDIKALLNLFMLYRNFFTEGKSISLKEAPDMMHRFRRYMKENNVTKDLTVELDGNKFIVQYFGNSQNIHYDNSKWIASFAGILGLKLTKINYSTNYTRFDLELTSLFIKSEPMIEERSNLFISNCKKFTNYARTINDEDRLHFWMKLAKNNKVIITFGTVEDGLRYISDIIEDLRKNPLNDKLISMVMKMFHHFGWIKIEDLEEYSFICKLNNNHLVEKEIIKKVFIKLELEIRAKGTAFALYEKKKKMV
jgi:hypothetical protein